MDPFQKIYRLLLLILVFFVFWLIFPFISPLILILIFSFLLTSIFLQPVDYIESYVKSRKIGVMVVLGTSMTVFILFIGSFLTNFGYQIRTFSDKIQKDNFAIAVENLSKKIKLLLPDFFNNLVPESDKIILVAKNFMVNIFQNILLILGSAGNFLFVSFMVLVFTVILLVEYHNFKKSLVRFIPNKFLEIGLRTIYNIEQQISKYLRGQILVASSVSILSILGLLILNKSGANITLVLFIGVIAGLANLIPMVGPFIGMIPAILIAVMNNIGNESAITHHIFNVIPSPFFILDIVVMFILVQQIDNNFITPLVVGESVGLHPMIVMIVLIIGATLIGPIGMLFAIPATGVLKVLLREIIFISKNSHLL